MSDRTMPKYLDDLVKTIPEIDEKAKQEATGRRPGLVGLGFDLTAAAEPVFVGALVGGLYWFSINIGLGEEFTKVLEQYQLQESMLGNYKMHSVAIAAAGTLWWNWIKLITSRRREFAQIADANRWRYVADKLPEYYDIPHELQLVYGNPHRRSVDTLTEMRFDPDHYKRIGAASFKIEGGREYGRVLSTVIGEKTKFAAFNKNGDFYACTKAYEAFMQYKETNPETPFDNVVNRALAHLKYEDLVEGVTVPCNFKGAAYEIDAFIPPISFFNEDIYEKWIVIRNA